MNELKKKAGTLVIQANSEILDLQHGYRKVNSGGSLTRQEKDKETVLKAKVLGLEEAVKVLKANIEHDDDSDNLSRLVKLIETTIDTANIILTSDAVNFDEVLDENKVLAVKTEVELSLKLIKSKEEKVNSDINSVSDTLSKLLVSEPENTTKSSQIEEELSFLESYVKERFGRIEREIEKKMKDYIKKLEKVWKEEKEMIDYTGLKEVKHEFDQGYSKLR